MQLDNDVEPSLITANSSDQFGLVDLIIFYLFGLVDIQWYKKCKMGFLCAVGPMGI